MTGKTDAVLDNLLYIRSKIDVMSSDVKHLDGRMGAVERHLATIYGSDVAQNREIDRLKRRVDRIEQKLSLPQED
jgi:outer membrane murein-binding lipoprotein Lpp